MSYKKEQKIITLKSQDNASNNKLQIEKVGTNLSDDTDLAIKAMGEQNVANAATIDASILDQGIKKDAEIAATAKVHEGNVDGCNYYNETAVAYMKKYPGDAEKWAKAGFLVSSDEAHDRKAPAKPENCKMMQGDYPKQCVISFNTVADADNFTVEITIDDPMDASKYIMVTKPKPVFTKIKFDFLVPDAYLGKVMWAKVTAHNTGGDSPASEPFGGKIIQ
ncbi:MAG: hypothetical protein WCH34_08905 [Bacteroidota bacterium]